MAKDKLTDYDSTASGNLDVGGISVAEGMLPSGVNNAIRELMSHQADAFGAGTPLYVDQTNNRLGINQAAPAHPLHVGTDDLIVDASGNLLVGQSTTALPGLGNTTTGISLAGQYDIIAASRTSGASVLVNRNTDDGDLIQFSRNGNTAGDIGVNNGDNLRIQGNSSHSGIEFGTNALFPHKNGSNVDATIDLGESSLRWKDLYLSGGVRATGSLDLTVPETAGAAVQVEFGNNTNTTRRTVQVYKDNIQPAVADDAVLGLGTPTARFSNLYLSGGVYLGGTGSANHLDDYEEGSWTPVLAGATTTTYTSQIGRYTKVGELVYVFFDIQINSLGNGQQTTVVGLPFPPYNNDALAVSYWAGLALSPYFIGFQIGGGPQALAVGTTAAGSAIQNGMAIFQNGSRIIASGCYRTSS